MTASLNGAEQSALKTPFPRRPPSSPVAFLGAEEAAELESLSPPLSSPLEDLEGLSPSDSESPLNETDEDDESAPRSSRASSGGSALGKKALKAATIKGVLIGTEMAHRAVARTEGQRQVGLMRADDEDAENIGDPLTELIHRRGGIAGAAAAANPDVGDAIRMMMGLANFASKQVAAAMEARAIDEAHAAGFHPDEVG